MKKLLFLMLLCNFSFAQKIDYNKVILPKTAQNIDLGERLVQIAWENNPQNRVLEIEKNVARENVRLARWSWLDNIYAVYNVNEDNAPWVEKVVQTNTNGEVINNNNNFYPRYNFGVRISLGDLVRVPLQTQKAKEQLSITAENINSRKLELRSTVLVQYQNYIMNRELLKIQTEITEDISAAYTLAEKKFKDGDLTFEAYNQALQNLNGEKVKKITAENLFMISKIRLEEIVGVRMEDVE